MSKFFKGVLIGSAMVGGGALVYKKLLTPEAQQKLVETTKNVVDTAKGYIDENNLKAKKEAKLNLITVLDKTDQEWSRLGY